MNGHYQVTVSVRVCVHLSICRRIFSVSVSILLLFFVVVATPDLKPRLPCIPFLTLPKDITYIPVIFQ